MAQAEKFEYEGKMYTGPELAKVAGVHQTTMYLRLVDHKRDPQSFPMKYVMTGQGHTGIPSSTIRNRRIVLREEGLPAELATMKVWGVAGKKGTQLRQRTAKTILKSKKTDAVSHATALNISDFRKQHRITQKDLAEIAGVSQFSISILERGVGNANPTTRRKVVDAMKAIGKAANPTKRPVHRITKPVAKKKQESNWLVVDLEDSKRDEMKKLLSSLLKMLG